MDKEKFYQNGNIREYGSPPALAQEGTDALPQELREKGFAAIDAIGSALLEAFPKDAHHFPLEDSQEMKDLLNLLHLDQFGLDLKSVDDLGTPSALITEIARVAKLNPILVVAAAKFQEQSNWKESFPAPCKERDAELRKAITYCYLLHCVAKAYANEPLEAELPEGHMNFAEKLFKHFYDLLNYTYTDWDGIRTLFEHSKQIAVFKCWELYYIRYKKGKDIGAEKYLRGPLLSINILEAVLQDLKTGYINNACCGYELFLEPGNRVLTGTGGTKDYIWMRPDGRKSGVLCMQQPLPIIWSNLYMAWNLAFCSDQYSDWPFFFAKLLNPAVLGCYHEVDTGFFMAQRLPPLLVHIAYVGLQRQAAKQIVKGKLIFFHN